jgi:uncharacterized membrane protein
LTVVGFGRSLTQLTDFARYSRPGMAETAARSDAASSGTVESDELAIVDETLPTEAPDEDAPEPPSAGRSERFHALVDRVRAEPAVVLLCLAIVVWFVMFGRLIWLRHARFATFDFDLGHHDQAIWLLAHGKGFITVSGMPVLGHHLTLAYFALAPLYWLGGGPQLINLLQIAALALSAVPIFLYARDRLGNGWLALTFGVAWLLNPTVQWLCWEAFHPETMAIPFVLMTWLMASRNRRGWYWIFLVAALTWKEDIALAVIGIGIVLLVRKQRRLGLLTIAVGVVWFLVAYGIVMPAFNGGTNHAGIFYGELGDSPSDLIRTTFTDPTLVVDRLQNNDALGYARDLLAPFAFTSLLAPLLLVPAIPQFFANILTNLNFFWSIQFHYAAIIVSFVALSSIDGVARLKSLPVRRFAVGAVAAAALATSVAWGMSPISTQYRNGYWALYTNPRQAAFDAAVDAVPSDAAVSATYNIVPHLSHREQIYTFPNPWFPLNWGVAGVAPDDPDHDHVPAEVDWIVVDRTTHVPDGREEQLIDSLLESDQFVVVSDELGILVARRDEEPAEERKSD